MTPPHTPPPTDGGATGTSQAPSRCQTRGMRTLDAQSAIRTGGWDPRSAVTLAVAVNGDVAAALIDTNGDGAAIDLDEYRREPDGEWQSSMSGSADDQGQSWSSTLVATWGRAAPHQVVEIELLGERTSVVASESGWWLFVASSTDDLKALPRPLPR